METSFYGVNTPTYYTAVAGTHGFDDNPAVFEWYEAGSVFTEYMKGQNLVLHPRSPFIWSTSLDGVIFKRELAIWKAAARHFMCHVEPMAQHERNFIAHSHGGQLIFQACAYGLKINNLVTVGTPVRKDMELAVKAARPNINFWLHICDSKRDFTSVFGAVFDGTFRIEHEFSLADMNHDIRGVGHSKVLRDEYSIPMWASRGWAKRLVYGHKVPE